MPQNEHSREDIMYVLQPTRGIMLAMGAWPSLSGNRSMYKKMYDILLNISSYFLLSCEIYGGVIFWLLEETLRIRLQTTPLLLYVFMTVIQYGILLSRNDHIRQCVKYVEEDYENIFGADVRNIMLKCAKTGRLLTAICGLFMYSGGITYRIIYPLSQGEIVVGQNLTIRSLACPVNFIFFDHQVSPVYEIIFVAQSLTGFVIASVTTSACGLTAIFVVHACGQLKILVRLMRNLVEEKWVEEREINEKLAAVVKHQIRVRRFLELVQYTVQEICLLEILVNTLTICLLLYFMILDWETSNKGVLSNYLTSSLNVIIHIFLFCYAGEQLSKQAEKVAMESSTLEWYRLPDKQARSLILLMIMSNVPSKISAGKIMDLSFRMFGDIMKTSGAYFNMLRSVME